ncbi:hypothetical protein SDC9_177307 [bioreactor metagenome]|uniref:Uncharacterized protein n=1 Tax=bioreactor metagenome TaxID=1076179 RepID=A0A645H0L3_9ZZZZ
MQHRPIVLGGDYARLGPHLKTAVLEYPQNAHLMIGGGPELARVTSAGDHDRFLVLYAQVLHYQPGEGGIVDQAL